MVTAKDVADKAGVSQATVSYVMNGNRPISDEVKKRVRRVMKELGYYPNAAARALAGNGLGTIAFVVQLEENTQMEELLPFITTIITDARNHGYNVMVLPAEEGVDAIERLVGQALVDAVIVMDIKLKDRRISRIAKLSVPTVLVGNPDDPHGLHCVDIDYDSVVRLAMDEIDATGAEKVIAVGDSRRARDSFWFARVFEEKTRELSHRMGIEYELFRPEVPTWSGMMALSEKMNSWESGVYGVVARTPRDTDRIIQLMFEKGMVPGRDAYLIGVCEDSVAEELRAPVTNVSPSAEEVSHRATTTLFDLLEGRTVHEIRQFVQPVLTRRKTSVL